MSYPFRFRLGDLVRITSGHYKGVEGTVKALELSEQRTVAIIERSHRHSGPRPVRENESALALISAAHKPAEMPGAVPA